MSDKTNQIKSELFDYAASTYATSYKFGQFTKPIHIDYKQKPKIHRQYQFAPVRKYEPPVVPFSLFHKPKDIIGTLPREVAKLKTVISNEDDKEAHLNARKTRPRLVMTPAVSMDDIDDEHARTILCKELYTTETMKAQAKERGAVSNPAPLSELAAPAKPIPKLKLIPPVVAPEWRMETVTWDNKQLRSYTATTEEFWKNRPLSSCRICDQSAIVTAHRKMQMKQRGLR